MKLRIVVVAALVSSPAIAQNDSQPSPYAELNKQVQEKLRAESFYNGPINGEFGFYTQAALAQFQLSRALPASGSLDATTLAAMGLEQAAEQPASAGESPGSGASAPAR
jgi:peptidoglycan hydrolase-like protein with peptidoglycan-binding domain